MTAVHSEQIVDLYERHARDFDSDRSRSLFEKVWLDRFTALLPPRATVLDVGCGMGEPIAAYLIECGFTVLGIDSSPSMVDLCRRRFPSAEWLIGDMRAMSLGRRFDDILAWDSFFHLSMTDQRGMFPRFAAHVQSRGPLMFTSGPREGEAIGSYYGEPLFHASLSPAEYERLLISHGFTVAAHQAEDPQCGGHTVWLARCQDGDR